MKFLTILSILVFAATAQSQNLVNELRKGNSVLTLNQDTRLWFGYNEGIACDDYNEEGNCVNPRLIFVADKPVELSQLHSVRSYNDGDKYCLLEVETTGTSYENDIRTVVDIDSSVKFKYVFPLQQNSDATFIEQTRALRPKIASMPLKQGFNRPKVEVKSVVQYKSPFTICDGEYSSYRCDTYEDGVELKFKAAVSPTVKVVVKCKAQSAAVLPNGAFSVDVINSILKGDYILETLN